MEGTQSSFVLRRMQTVRRRVGAAVTASGTAVRLAALGNALSRAGGTSLLGRFGVWARGGYLYRWLTAEPDPAVVVIDLRETWTVGPILAALDWLFGRAERPWTASGLRELVARTADAGREAPIRLLGIALLLAVIANIVVTGVVGTLSARGLGLRLLLGGTALLATRIDVSAADLRGSRLGRAVTAVLEPPEPPEGEG